MSAPKVGTIGWLDLTVADATGLRNFYGAVVGWTSSEVDMGGYSDYCMHPEPDSPPMGGVCHARGQNSDLPPVWLIYVTVADLDASLARCRERGGTVLREPRGLDGESRFAVIRDPAGAVLALYQAGRATT